MYVRAEIKKKQTDRNYFFSFPFLLLYSLVIKFWATIL